MNFRRSMTALTAGALAAVFATCSGSVAASSTPQAAIPFADHGGIYDWRANGDKGIWIQSVGGKWFYGSFMGTCLGLDTALRVGFKSEPTGQFDRWSTIVVPHEPQCHLASFEQSAGPPRRGELG